MKSKIYFLMLLLFSFATAMSQNKTITGNVSSEGGETLSGVTITVKGTRIATTTNTSGHYSISVPETGKVVLVFSYVGGKTQEINVGNHKSINVSMSLISSTLNDVVVVGYGSVKRKDLTGSVSSISAQDLKDVTVNSAEQMLNGRLAGVTATTAEGSPDATVTIRVRGGLSITGDNSPLYIVDGVQVENALSTIAPQDIQSIDVLKDAASTAIYGARGANGVIIITTKSGRHGRLRVTYNGFVGIKTLAKKLKVLDPYDYVIYQSERSRGSSADSATFLDDFGSTWDTLENYKNTPPVNWQDEVFGRTGITTTHNISLSGGSQKITYNFGYTYNNEKAIVLNSNYERHALNFKTDYRITKKLKVGVTARYTDQNVLGAGVSSDQGSAYNRLRNAVKYRPYLSKNQTIDDADPIADPGVGNGLNLVNPILLANSEYRRKTTDAFNFAAYVSYDIVKNLSFKSTFGYNQSNITDRQFSDSLTPYSIIQGAAKPIVRLDTSIAKTITNSNVLTYSVKGYKGKHDISLLVGEETYDLRSESRSDIFGSYPTGTSHSDAFKQTNLGTSFTGYPRLGKTRYTNLSFFSRLNYAYLDKYLFSFDVRADGASKFAPGRQWGYFPSGSFAWRVKNEKFLQNVNFINDLKFRVGFGTVGNNRIDDYLYLTTFKNDGSYYYGLNGNPVIAYYSAGLVNEKLQWESTVNSNYGMDVTLFNNRVNLSFDYYKNSSNHLLLNVPIASTYGYSSQLQNIGKSSNNGIEVQLNTIIIKKKDFSWTANFNISSNKNRIVALGQNQQYFYPDASWGVSGQPTDYIEKIGSPVGSMYGLVNDGFYTVNDFDYNTTTTQYTLKSGVVSDSAIIGHVQPGSEKFKDLNGDGFVDLNNDRTIIGNPTPKFTGGLFQQFNYKNWDMSLFLNFSYGNDVYNANKIEFTNGYTANANLLAIMKNRWKVITPDGATAQYVSGSSVYGIPPDQLAALNANATIWQPLKSAGAFYPSSWAMEDGSFLRINNVTIGYSLPQKSIIGLKMTKLRFYVTVNNLAVITGYSGYDPEVSVRRSPLTPGLDYSAYPKSRSYIFGVNASF
jgi:TonB-dependent starch-binding outer membrane protein SusC